MVSMSSTLVETVSINYEDFNESFLTCGTCLCMYDGSEHTPKLLPCSHTVCLHCLLRIASHAAASPTFRCPICREQITVPRGGVAALPPSFLVNQLLDLMASQRRDVVPKCSVHFNQELLFCETCDTVFCAQCTIGSHSSSTSILVGTTGEGSSSTSTSCEHTVIPFSIAIKRMSEILLYKANECISKLSEAEDAVREEVSRLETTTQGCIDKVGAIFSEAESLVTSAKRLVTQQLLDLKQTKLSLLQAQLDTVRAEKDKVTEECDGLQYQVEVRNISQRITALSEKLEAVSSLCEPKENCFIACNIAEGYQQKLNEVLSGVVSVRTSTTLVRLSTLELLGECIINLECIVVLTTYDYEGARRTVGGDPVSATVTHLSNNQHCSHTADNNGELTDVTITDVGDGTYLIKFRPTSEGEHRVSVTVLDRRVGPGLTVRATVHNDPVICVGSRGQGKDQFLQPVAVSYLPASGEVYIADTGNCRVKVLASQSLDLIRHIEHDCLRGRSCTGIACYHGDGEPWLATVNWRTATVTRLTTEGEMISSFSHTGFQEPIDIAVDPTYGHILVADNGPCCVFAFDMDGKFLFQVGSKGCQAGCFNLISAVAVGPDGEIIVADSRIQVFSAKGDFLQEIYPEGKGKGRYGGLTADSVGRILGSRSEKGRNMVQVFSLQTGRLLSTIDSHSARLKRPSGLCTTGDNHVIVVDLGNDSIKRSKVDFKTGSGGSRVITYISHVILY
ncbi:uncharacterized protein isoform X2 [Rhodnius prolixus]|uniref:uncharacterized protein isoform X2 n=1 Tax=Rhodnius prolixus TaxID=13249 RepID=UPI003D18A9DD